MNDPMNVSMKDMTELAVKYLKERKGIEIGAEAFFYLDKAGGLSHVYETYWNALAYYKMNTVTELPSNPIGGQVEIAPDGDHSAVFFFHAGRWWRSTP